LIRTVVEHGNRFAVHPPYWFVASMNPDEELEVRMAVSSDRGATFSTSHFPYKLSEKSYRVVDSKESSVFVQVMILATRARRQPIEAKQPHSSKPTRQLA
jgi:hypothetical protein